jgi:prolyl-tRNA synthetase
MADDMHDESKIPQGIKLESSKAIEIGHIFNFGTKYSEPCGAYIKHKDNKDYPVHMGSYGIGVSRLFAAIIEASHDENGIIWPEAVAPFKYAIVDGINLIKENTSFYTELSNRNFDFIYDDKDDNIGAKLNKWTLFGIPYQVIIGRHYRDSKKIEVKSRKTGASELCSIEEFFEKYK